MMFLRIDNPFRQRFPLRPAIRLQDIAPLPRLAQWLLRGMLVLTVLTGAAWADTDSPDYQQGVQAYRNGQFDAAQKIFAKLAKEMPTAPEVSYYLGISTAQLGRYKEAKAAYEAVIKMDPNGEAAELARQGLSYLPNGKQLDTPPRFQGAPAQAAAPQANPMGMDANMMQMMMMMGSMGGSNNGGGFNPMMIPMMQSMSKNNGQSDDPDNNPSSWMTPEMMSSMIMNQMIQELGPMGSGKE